MPNAVDPRAWNRFGYVYGSPTNFVDPSGHFPIWDFVDVGSFALGLADFLIEPSWANAGLLALDAVGLLPFIPGVAGARHVGGLGGVDNALRTAGQLSNLTSTATHADEVVKVIDEGYAIIKGYEPPPGQRLPHFSVEVRHGNVILETDQVIRSSDLSSTTIRQVRVSMPPSKEPRIVPLPNAKAAQEYQRSVIRTELGPYGLDNSCVTHVCDVLRAGGASGVPNPSRGGLRDISYLKKLGFSDLFSRP